MAPWCLMGYLTSSVASSLSSFDPASFGNPVAIFSFKKAHRGSVFSSSAMESSRWEPVGRLQWDLFNNSTLPKDQI